MKGAFCRVRLEPELELLAADWSPLKRLEMARVYARRSRQLRIVYPC